MSKKTWLIATGAVIAVGYGGYRILASRGSGPSAPLETVTAAPGVFEAAVEASGSLAAAQSVPLAFTAGGRVAEVLVKIGDTVVAGQPLALLDTSDLMLQVKAAEANQRTSESGLGAQRAGLASQGAGPTQLEIDLAKVNVDKAKDSRWGVQAIRDSTCGKEKPFFEQAACDQADANVLAAEDSVRIAELQYEQTLIAPGDVDLRQAREQVRQAEGQVAGAAVQVEQARLEVQQAALVSPITGTVTQLALEAGQQVGGGQTALTVSDLARLEIGINLDETDVSRVSVGQAAQITLDAFRGEALTGELTNIAPAADASSGVPLYLVTVSLEPGKLPLRPGMTAEVRIVTEQEAGVIVIPLRAVQSQGDQTVVRLLPLGATAPVSVTVRLGRSNDTDVVVSQGIKAGDIVVVGDGQVDAGSGGGPFGGGPP